jgi:integrase
MSDARWSDPREYNARDHARTLDGKQAKAFLKAGKKHRLGPLFSVALAVGLRLGEALGLEWDAVDLTKGTLTVRQALQRVGKKLEMVEPKSDKSRRTVHLPSATVTVLKRHRTQQKRDRLSAGGEWRQSNLHVNNRHSAGRAERP